MLSTQETSKENTIPFQQCIWCSATEDNLSIQDSKLMSQNGDLDQHRYSVNCEQCGARGPLCKTQEEAIIVWNTTTFSTENSQDGKLTVRKIKEAEPKEKLYRIGDSNGLCLEIAPSGSKLWRFRYYFDGKAKMIGLGSFPETSLDKARNIRDEQRETLKKGTDPSKIRQEQRVNNKEIQEQSKIISKIDSLIRQLRKSKKSLTITP